MYNISLGYTIPSYISDTQCTKDKIEMSSAALSRLQHSVALRFDTQQHHTVSTSSTFIVPKEFRYSALIQPFSSYRTLARTGGPHAEAA